MVPVTEGPLTECLLYHCFCQHVLITFFFDFQVKYRDVPGIDTAYLAMDTEEGVEVVWNEAQFSGAKKFKAQARYFIKPFISPVSLVFQAVVTMSNGLKNSIKSGNIHSIILDVYVGQ